MNNSMLSVFTSIDRLTKLFRIVDGKAAKDGKTFLATSIHQVSCRSRLSRMLNCKGQAPQTIARSEAEGKGFGLGPGAAAVKHHAIEDSGQEAG